MSTVSPRKALVISHYKKIEISATMFPRINDYYIDSVEIRVEEAPDKSWGLARAAIETNLGISVRGKR